MRRGLHSASVAVGLGGSVDPLLLDRDLLVWPIGGALDDGTTARMKCASAPGIFDLTATGTRPVLDANGLDVGCRGWVTDSAASALTVDVGAFMNGRTAYTLWVSYVDRGVTTYGGIASLGAFASSPSEAVYYDYLSGFPRASNYRVTTGGNATEFVDAGKEPLEYARVLSISSDLATRVSLASDGFVLGATGGGAAAPYTSAAFGASCSLKIAPALAPLGVAIPKAGIGSVALARTRVSASYARQVAARLAAFNGQGCARNFALCGDSRFACSAVGSAQWVKAMLALYDARRDGRRYLRLTGPFRGAEQTAFAHDRTWSAHGQTITGWATNLGSQGASGYRTDIAIVSLGVNDVVNSGSSAATAVAALKSAIETAAAAWPGALFVVLPTTISPSYSDPSKVAIVAALNDLLPGMVSALAAEGISARWDRTLLDMPLVWLSDGLHWDPASEGSLAAYFEALTRSLAGV